MIKRLLTALLFAMTCMAQTPVTVTGLVTDAGNNPATSGYVQFDILPTASSVHYFIAGFGTISQTTRCGINASGQVLNLALSGACTVWGNDLINPANTQYRVTIAPGGVISNVVPGECITGSSYSLSNPVFCPQVQVNPQQAIIRANPFQTNIIPLTASVFNIGSPLAPYAAVYTNSLFLNGLQFSTATLRATWGGVAFGMTNTGAVANYLPSKSIVITGIGYQVPPGQTLGVGCSTAPSIRVSDGTTISSTLTLSNGTASGAGALNVSYPANDNSLRIEVAFASSGCGTQWGNVNVWAEFRLQ
jgi:hypothetical protein